MPNMSSGQLPNVVDGLYIELEKNPVYVYVGRLVDERSRHFHAHKHDRIVEILYIASGEATFIIDGTEYQAQSGDILVVNSGVTHEEFHRSEQAIEMYYFAVSNFCIKGLKEQCLVPPHIPPVLNAGSEESFVRTLFYRLFEEGYAKKPGYDIICNDLVSIICTVVLRMISETIGILEENLNDAHPRILSEKIKRYIDSNFAQDITVGGLASEFHITQSYLAHIFKKYIGIPPIRYQVTRRMYEAKRLLSCTNLKITVIASTVGYENINNFYEPFKKYAGVTPNQYRQLLKQQTLMEFYP